MINILKENIPGYIKKLDRILKPIEKDLSLLEDNLKGNLYSGNFDLDKMVSYFFSSGGKRLRPAIILLFSKAISKGHLTSKNFELALAVEMIHTASLIHDDVIDNSETRRGIITLNQKWGAKTAVITGDYILSKALEKLTSINILAVEMFSKTLNDLCVGEILQKNQSYNIISLEEYINKSERKTAKLFMAGTECAAAITPGTNNLIINAARGYSVNYGIAFQIIDDILNFNGILQKIGKPVANDLKNGIITAPVIFANQEMEKKGDFTLRKLINKKFKNEKDFKKALKIVLESDGINKSRELALEYVQKALVSLDMIDNNSYKQALIDLAFYTVNRSS